MHLCVNYKRKYILKWHNVKLLNDMLCQLIKKKTTLSILIVTGNTDEHSVMLFVNSTAKLNTSFFQFIFKWQNEWSNKHILFDVIYYQ